MEGPGSATIRQRSLPQEKKEAPHNRTAEIPQTTPNHRKPSQTTANHFFIHDKSRKGWEWM